MRRWGSRRPLLVRGAVAPRMAPAIRCPATYAEMGTGNGDGFISSLFPFGFRPARPARRQSPPRSLGNDVDKRLIPGELTPVDRGPNQIPFARRDSFGHPLSVASLPLSQRRSQSEIPRINVQPRDGGRADMGAITRPAIRLRPLHPTRTNGIQFHIATASQEVSVRIDGAGSVPALPEGAVRPARSLAYRVWRPATRFIIWARCAAFGPGSTMRWTWLVIKQ